MTISPVAVDDSTWQPLPMHAFQIHVGLMQAYSRGQLTLRHRDPSVPPKILVNYLQDSRDIDLLRRGIHIVRNLVSQPAFDGLCGEEIYPGKTLQTDEELHRCIVDKCVSQWHLSGTARMGRATDQGAVVDSSARVYGIDRLRVVDASIMPVVTNGNTNAPTIMMAEKVSDAILGKTALPGIDVPVWSHTDGTR